MEDDPSQAGSDTIASILATTDLTEAADASLRSTAALGEVTGAAVHLFHCVKRPGPFGSWEDDPARRTEDALRALRSQLARVCGPGWGPASTHVAIGSPSTEISNRAKEVGADVIVLGAHRPRGRWDTLLGTTADRVIRTAQAPCLLAHEPLRAPLRTILLATDFSPPSRRALDVLADWLVGPLRGAWPEADSLHCVLLCVSAYAGAQRPPASLAALLERETQHFRGRTGDPTGIRVEPLIHSAPLVVEGVDKVASDRSADLVVLGTHGYHPISRMLLGSVASAIAASVRRPLLLVPPHGGDGA